MRSDFLGDCSRFTDLAETINDGQFLAPRLTREQCRQAIEGPAAVYDGKVEAQVDDRAVEVGKGKQLPLEPAAERKPTKFNRDETDDLMAWSKLRSEYLAEANASSVRTVVVSNPSWWTGTGWYWNPWYGTWAFVPANGFYDNPWGFGFYSPRYFFYNPPVYYYPRPGWRGPVGGRVIGPGVRPPAQPAGRIAPTARPAPMGGRSVHLGRGR